MPYVLNIVDATGVPKKLTLPAKGTVSFGRGTMTDVQVEDDEVSRTHCQFDCKPAGVTLVDLGSSNGTRHNGEKVEYPTPLRPGDEVRIGHTYITLEATGAEAEAEDQGEDYVCLSCGRMTRGACPKCGFFFIMPVDGISNLRIEKRLGAGGMGVVFLARQGEEGIPVAMKVMAFIGEPPQGALERFIREAKIPEKLDHPNVVRVLGSGGFQLKPLEGITPADAKLTKAGYIVLEFVQGRELTRIVGQEGPMKLWDAVRIGRD
ncbi:MAG: serine/threonine-protein kinase, partial [Planctomycetota bacterium]